MIHMTIIMNFCGRNFVSYVTGDVGYGRQKQYHAERY